MDTFPTPSGASNSKTADRQRASADRLRAELNRPGSSRTFRRATALLAIQQGMTIRETASLLGVSRQTVYNWRAYYSNGDSGVNLGDAPRSGRPSLWTREMLNFVQNCMAQSPDELGLSGEHWTSRMLQTQLKANFARAISSESIRRQLKGLGYQWKGGGYVRLLIG